MGSPKGYAAAAEGEMTLYNAQGRLVRRLALRCQRGENSFPFDGKSESGSALAPGVYFLRMRVGHADLGAVKLVLLGHGQR